MQIMIMVVKIPLPPLENGRCRYVVPVTVCKYSVSSQNKNTYWHLGMECEHPQLKLNVSQLTIKKIHLIIPVFTHNAHSNQKSEQI